ncbi:MAG: acyltransferase [Polyangiales bacterium]
MSRVVRYLSFRRVPGQLPELDGLRGLAIILVVLRHGVQPYPLADHALFPIFGWDLGTFFTNGWIGVDLFFVLSGFLITHHILRSREKHAGGWRWRPYLEKRALRIVPAYYAVLLLAANGWFSDYDISFEGIRGRIVYHLLFLQDYLPSDIVVTFWSLGVEEKFYLLAPFLTLALLKLPRLRQRVLGVVALIILGVGVRTLTAFLRPEVATYTDFFRVFRSPFHMTLDGLLIGVLIAVVYRARAEKPDLVSSSAANITFWMGAATILFVSTTSVMMKEITWWDKTLQPLVIASGFGGMTFGLIFGGGPSWIFGSLGLFFFARISYTLYLIHFPLIPHAISIATQLAPEASVFLVFFIIYLSLAIPFAILLHYLVEKPFLLLKDRVRD